MERMPVWMTVSLSALAAGCDDSTTLVLEPNPAIRVVIDPARCPSVDQCSSCVLETDAFDKNSNVAPLPTLIWSSSNETVATVESRPGGEGRVRGWTPGVATITVEVLETGATDEVGVLVTPPDPGIHCEPPGADRNAPSVSAVPQS